jgi:hypothetical protein
MCTPARIFSQIRGTPNRIVGWTSRRSWVTVAIDSPKWTVTPAPALNHTVKIRSATWHSGRYDSVMSCGPGGGEVNPPPWTRMSMANSTLATDSIAPLGGPVVPDV